MQIEIKTKHIVKFQVVTYWATEGGMEWKTYGKESDTLEEAIRILEVANIEKPCGDWHNWVIECYVETKSEVKENDKI